MSPRDRSESSTFMQHGAARQYVLTGLKGGKPDSNVVVHISGDASIKVRMDAMAAPREWPTSTKPVIQ